jgi:ribosomal protein S18 acetylase RimI-like enzyme
VLSASATFTMLGFRRANETIPGMLTFVPMSEVEVESWLSTTWDEYLAEILASGTDLVSAKRNVQSNKDQLFPEGKPTEGQYFLNIVDDGAVVGSMWLKDPLSESSGVWFIYDIVIDERFRGKGFGRRAMKLTEDWVRERGGTRLTLNVFGHNVVARGLYDSLGYRTQAMQMFKDL